LKLTTERRWWLAKWDRMGWHIGDPMRASVKKWRAHTEALIKSGLLEADRYEGLSAPMCRLTDAGQEAIARSAIGSDNDRG
jgi:hypothetical protein